MIDSCKLPFRFDAKRLSDDLAGVGERDWIRHFNAEYYEGEWSALALRAIGGDTASIYPDPSARGTYADTPLLARCPYLREVLGTFQCPLTSVRLLSLGPGGRIREHRDHDIGYGDRELRLHVPILTNPQVAFYLEGRRVVMQAGECWYLDFNLRHSVVNGGETPRVHLVIDCVLDAWLEAVFTELGFPERREAGIPQPEWDEQDRRRIIDELRRLGTDTAMELAERMALQPPRDAS